jgi:hypothetical protein
LGQLHHRPRAPERSHAAAPAGRNLELRLAFAVQSVSIASGPESKFMKITLTEE